MCSRTPGWLLEETFRKHRNLDTTARVSQVAREMEQKIGIQYNYDLMPDERKALKAAKGSKLEYADVFPLIYLKMRLEGIRSPYRNVKHLLIDEMQDYTPVQYAVIARLFSCKTQKQAKKLHRALEGESTRLQLLSEDSQSFAPGVIVCTAHLAKGLFDHVILPEVTEGNYFTDMDRNLLYVGCTRAMHRLTLTANGEVTELLAPV